MKLISGRTQYKDQSNVGGLLPLPSIPAAPVPLGTPFYSKTPPYPLPIQLYRPQAIVAYEHECLQVLTKTSINVSQFE